MLEQKGIKGMPGFVSNEIELDRDVQKKLAAWKEKRHQVVLQVEGPGKVGMTHEIRKFAYSCYDRVIYVNLVRDEFGFEDLLSEKNFMTKYCERAGLEAYRDDAGTVLIIDEIQESQVVYNAIRDLRERLQCDIIVSGSYLARTVNSRDFFLPAGIAYLRMYPLSFQEFCRAAGLEECLIGLDPYGNSEKASYEKLEQAYQVYRRIGGYPQVVTTYIKTRNIADCMEVLGDLIRTFTAESSQFFSNSTALSVFHEVYKGVFVQMAEEKRGTGRTFLEFVTNFVKDSVKEPVSRNEVRSASSWLFYSGIIGFCDLYNNGDVSDVVSNRRAYFMDTGIANYISTLVTVPKDAVEGMLTETFAYGELNRLYQEPAGVRAVRGDKPCFSVCGEYELDFVAVNQNDKKIGVEVKTGNNRARSLEFFREKGLIDHGYKAIPEKGGHGRRYDVIPVYLVGRKNLYEQEIDE